MIPQKFRLLFAGFVAFLIGMPLSERAFGQSLGSFIGFVVDASVYASDGDS